VDILFLEGLYNTFTKNCLDFYIKSLCWVCEREYSEELRTEMKRVRMMIKSLISQTEPSSYLIILWYTLIILLYIYIYIYIYTHRLVRAFDWPYPGQSSKIGTNLNWNIVFLVEIWTGSLSNRHAVISWHFLCGKLVRFHMIISF
jgi:hypothetical protein